MRVLPGLQVMSALHMIMQKWKTEHVFRDMVDMDPDHVQLRIVMLGKLCGAVIGENGKTINDIKMATSTEIRVQVRAWCCAACSALHYLCCVRLGAQLGAQLGGTQTGQVPDTVSDAVLLVVPCQGF